MGQGHEMVNFGGQEVKGQGHTRATNSQSNDSVSTNYGEVLDSPGIAWEQILD